MVLSGEAVLRGRPRDNGHRSFAPVVIISLVFHLMVFVGIPFLSTLIYRSDKFERPKTFSLVSMSPHVQQIAQQKPLVQPKSGAAKPKPKTATTPVPKKQNSKSPAKEKQKEDTDELNELLSSIPAASVSDIAPSQSFKYPWYLNSVVSKVEENWKPPMGLTESKNASVTVQFTIFAGGDISSVAVVEPSGISTLDNIAVKAVHMAAPFGKLPVGFRDDKLDIRYVLHYVKE
jgi:TonB family protein